MGLVAARHRRGEVEAAVALHQAVQILVLRLLKMEGRPKIIARSGLSISESSGPEFESMADGLVNRRYFCTTFKTTSEWKTHKISDSPNLYPQIETLPRPIVHVLDLNME